MYCLARHQLTLNGCCRNGLERPAREAQLRPATVSIRLCCALCNAGSCAFVVGVYSHYKITHSQLLLLPAPPHCAAPGCLLAVPWAWHPPAVRICRGPHHLDSSHPPA
jgi:hypothetical protein